MASDAFFPFPDCVEIADQAGITAVIQPGGSIKDQLSMIIASINYMVTRTSILNIRQMVLYQEHRHF